jgi:hypothetical protein
MAFSGNDDLSCPKAHRRIAAIAVLANKKLSEDSISGRGIERDFDL